MESSRAINGQQIILFVIVLLLMLGIGTWVFQLSATVTSNINRSKDHNLKLANHAQQMQVDVIQIQQWLTDISATRGRDGLDDGFAEAENSYQSFLTGLDVFMSEYQTDGNMKGIAGLDELRSRIDAYYAMGKKMANAYIEGGSGQGNSTMGQFDEAAESLSKLMGPFLSDQVKGINLSMTKNIESVDSLKRGILTIFITGFFAIVVITMVQNRINNRRMSRILKTLEAVAQGDLAVDLEIKGKGKGDMDKIAITFNRLVTRLTEVINNVKIATDSIAQGSVDIAAGNLNLSQRTEGQASSLEETASSMEEMTSTVRQNADSAQQAVQLAVAARDEAEKGVLVVDRTVDAMSEINSSSMRIADILATMDAIAFQTNLLALNAAVEAARAGEHGRGFAVVATEVRTLSQRSSEAAKEIKTLIDDSVSKVKIGTDLVDESGSTLMGIVAGVKKVADIISEINAASQEQSTGIDQVNTAVSQMDGMTQQNAALVEESAAASHSMQEQVMNLQQQMTFFKLKGADILPYSAPAIEAASISSENFYSLTDNTQSN